MDCKTIICQTKDSDFITLESDIAELVSILQKELSSKRLKAVVVGMIK